MAEHTVDTPDRMDYHMLPVTTGSILFKVQAGHDAHIALSPGPSEDGPIYEIFIGGWQNTKSVIRKNKQKPDAQTADTPDVLSAAEPRGFWLRWDNGSVKVGKEGQAAPFLDWTDPEPPFGIGHYGIRTGWGASGTWHVEDGDRSKRVDTEDKLEYQWQHVQQGCLLVEVRCPHNAHVALTSGPDAETADPMYEVLLGGWENMASVIRCRREKQPDKVRANTPALMSPQEYRRFCLAWKNGHLWVSDGEGNLLMEWRDTNPFGISHFGVRTAWGATGQWKVKTVERPELYPSDLRERALTAGSRAGALPGWAGGQGQCATWVDCDNGVVPANAVGAGQDNGEQLFVGRARHQGDIIPGKVVPSHRACYVPWGGEENAKGEYQVLCNCDPVWMPAVDGRVPAGALPGGESADSGETLFIGRATHNGVMCVGKVQESHGVCYVPYGGREHAHKEYEVLCAQ